MLVPYMLALGPPGFPGVLTVLEYKEEGGAEGARRKAAGFGEMGMRPLMLIRME